MTTLATAAAVDVTAAARAGDFIHHEEGRERAARDLLSALHEPRCGSTRAATRPAASRGASASFSGSLAFDAAFNRATSAAEFGKIGEMTVALNGRQWPSCCVAGRICRSISSAYSRRVRRRVDCAVVSNNRQRRGTSLRSNYVFAHWQLRASCASCGCSCCRSCAAVQWYASVHRGGLVPMLTAHACTASVSQGSHNIR